ncbi:daunorubicin C-13 ketoreductase [Colletotrichum eremochloae]|nr:daunorubicin C-13 ketoreductase [Colletotrichum eremochloae]
MPDLTGKVAVVTGGSTGLGFHIVKHLAAKGAKVYFTSRSETRAREAAVRIESLNPHVPSSQLIGLAIDLTDLNSVIQAAEKIKSNETKVDLFLDLDPLVGNGGGVIHGPRVITKSGWDMNIATNYIGHVLLVNLILPLMKAATTTPNSDVRIVMTSSNAIELFLPEGYHPSWTTEKDLALDHISETWRWRFFFRHLFAVDMFRYAMSKLAVSMFTKELQNRLDAESVPIICTSLNPGPTLSADVLSIFIPPMRPLVRKSFISPDQGSFNALFAATSEKVRDEPEKYKGRYMEPIGQLRTPHKIMNDPTQLEGLWNATMTSINRHLSECGPKRLEVW